MSILEASGTLYPKSIFPELKVKLVHEDAVLPTRAHPSDAGLDLYVVENSEVASKSSAVVSTGVCVDIPYGYVGLVYIRSSVGFKHNVTLSNSVGVIDSSYRGEIKIAVVNHGSSPFSIKKGDRIAQLVLTPVLLANPVKVSDLNNTARGDGGIGSSGR